MCGGGGGGRRDESGRVEISTHAKRPTDRLIHPNQFFYFSNTHSKLLCCCCFSTVDKFL